MLNFLTSSIRNKITAVILVAVISAVLISSVASALRQTYRQFDAKQDEIHGIAAAMAATIAGPVAASQRRQIAATLGAISRIPGLTYAAAQDNDGKILFAHGAGIVMQRSVSRQLDDEQIGPLGALYLNTYVADTSIVYGGKRIGTLTLIANLASLRNALLESLIISLAFGGLAAGIGIGAAAMLQRTITAPINALTQTMNEVRDTGDFNRKAERQSRDETGLMVDTFNAMLSEINQRDSALALHRDQLEATVLERTSDLEVAKTTAERANAAKSDFLATMSHEIRTPMNGMLVMAELLSASGLTPRLQRYADVVVKSGNSLLAIINDILDFSKIEAGKLELESIPVDPRRLVDDTLQLFSERATSANLEIAAHVAPNVPTKIVADPVRLGQVLTNLVNNALKFTETGGVLVSIELADQPVGLHDTAGLRFSVRDTGIGIPQDKLASIFDAFAQADQSTTREFGGTGIGLSICKRLIEAMDGELTVQSVVGEGSIFSFAAPFSVFEAAQIPTARRSPVTASAKLSDGITRDALSAALNDWNIQELRDLPSADPNATNLVFCDVEAIDQLQDSMSASSDVTFIAIGRFGDSQGDRLLEQKRVTCVLDRPLPVVELESLLHTALYNPTQLFDCAAREGDRQALPRAASFSGVKVLAADDSPVNREVLSEVLRRLDVQMTSVEDGVAAVEQAKTGNFDLVFMDGSMPRLDGFEATRQIREWEVQEQREPLPIVALTAHVVGEKGAKWRDAGMSDFISKPFSLAQIEACLIRLLDHSVQSPPDHGENLIADSASNDGPTALLDPDVLGMLRDIQSPDDNLVARVVSLYFEHAPVALSRLKDLETATDLSQIAEAAHALKSLSRNVGAIRVGELADGIEEQAQNEQTLPTPLEQATLAEALSDTLDALKQIDDLQTAA